VLRCFLKSFDTLEELTAKRHFVPAQSLVTHKRIKRVEVATPQLDNPTPDTVIGIPLRLPINFNTSPILQFYCKHHQIRDGFNQ
jgi:hypothetical protein